MQLFETIQRTGPIPHLTVETGFSSENKSLPVLMQDSYY